jgi:hypothetical protein
MVTSSNKNDLNKMGTFSRALSEHRLRPLVFNIFIIATVGSERNVGSRHFAHIVHACTYLLTVAW